MKRTLSRLKHTAKTISRRAGHRLRPATVADSYEITGLPYFSQWESPELVSDILSRRLKARDDPRWRQSGAKSKQEYEQWSWSACGMACTKMILAQVSGRQVPIVTLGKLAQARGVYGDLSRHDVGLRYAPYLTFVRQEFGWTAQLFSPMVREDIFVALTAGRYVIVSVSPAIREPQQRPPSRGGHLVLVTGYNKNTREFYLNNPSGHVKNSQQHARVSFSEFERSFAHRGIVIDTKS